MPKISDAMRAALLGQRKNMGSGGFVDDKNFTKDTFRIVPPPEGCLFIGIDVYNVFVAGSKKSYISPRTFGLMDPVCDILDEFRLRDKKKSEAANKVVNYSRQYWMGVLPRSNPGDASKVHLQVWKARGVPYRQIIDRAEEDGSDITDLKEGRDIVVKKEGTNTSTEWKITLFHDKSSVGQATPESPVDKEFQAAAVEAMQLRRAG